jgi:hypothetical protein
MLGKKDKTLQRGAKQWIKCNKHLLKNLPSPDQNPWHTTDPDVSIDGNKISKLKSQGIIKKVDIDDVDDEDIYDDELRYKWQTVQDAYDYYQQVR